MENIGVAFGADLQPQHHALEVAMQPVRFVRVLFKFGES
jgi:hypothetical protein